MKREVGTQSRAGDDDMPGHGSSFRPPSSTRSRPTSSTPIRSQPTSSTPIRSRPTSSVNPSSRPASRSNSPGYFGSSNNFEEREVTGDARVSSARGGRRVLKPLSPSSKAAVGSMRPSRSEGQIRPASGRPPVSSQRLDSLTSPSPAGGGGRPPARPVSGVKWSKPDFNP